MKKLLLLCLLAWWCGFKFVLTDGSNRTWYMMLQNDTQAECQFQYDKTVAEIAKGPPHLPITATRLCYESLDPSEGINGVGW